MTLPLSRDETDDSYFRRSSEPPTMTTRRQVLAAVGAAAVSLPGCLATDAPTDGANRSTTDRTTRPASSPATTGTTAAPASLPTGLVRRDGEVAVDATALADGDLSTAREGGITAFEYGPLVEASYQLAAVADGEMVTPGPDAPVLATSTLTPTDGTPRAFVVPAYRANGASDGDGGFTYEVFANAAFAAMDGLHVVAGTGNSFDGADGVGGHAAAFETVAPGILRDRIDSGAVPAADAGARLSVLVVDATPAEIRDRTSNATGVALLERTGSSGGPATRAPEVAFAFEEGDGTVTVTHEGGDHVEAARLTVLLDGEPAGAQFEGTVQAGDSVTLDVEGTASGVAVSVVWSPEGSDDTVPLARYRLE